MSLLNKVEPGYDINVGLSKGVNIGVGRLMYKEQPHKY